MCLPETSYIVLRYKFERKTPLPAHCKKKILDCMEIQNRQFPSNKIQICITKADYKHVLNESVMCYKRFWTQQYSLRL